MSSAEAPLSDSQGATRIADISPRIHAAITTDASLVPALDSPEFSQTIDHTLLKLDATSAQIDTLCDEALEYNFATVCVRANFASQAVSRVRDSSTRVAVVIGFHTGLEPTASKAAETRAAVSAGASELDIVLNRALLQAGEYAAVHAELATLRAEAGPKVLLKLILETARLSEEEIIAAAVLAHSARYEFIKTSTGFEGGGATEEGVRLMHAAAKVLGELDGWEMKVKASGGIRSADDAKNMLAAGAKRLGTSGGVGIVREARGGEKEEGKGGY